MIEFPPMPGICYAYVGWFKIWFLLNKRKKMWSFTTHFMFRSHCPRISKVFPWFFHILFDVYLIFLGFPRIFQCFYLILPGFPRKTPGFPHGKPSFRTVLRHGRRLHGPRGRLRVHGALPGLRRMRSARPSHATHGAGRFTYQNTPQKSPSFVGKF